MKHLIVMICLLAMVGCVAKRSIRDVRAYGEERFIADVIAIADGQPPSATLLSEFRPLRVEPCLNGAWLVYRESSSYAEGIYVDKISVEGWGGSGLEVTKWSTRVAWLKAKSRK
jgi:hypothetical protein